MNLRASVEISILTEIDSSLNNVANLMNNCMDECSLETINIGLRNLKTFLLLLCSRNPNIHPRWPALSSLIFWVDAHFRFSSLGNLLLRFEDSIINISAEIRHIRSYDLREVRPETMLELELIVEEVYARLTAASNPTVQSNSFRACDVVDITDFILKNAADFLDLRNPVSVGVMESLQVQVTFLKNLIFFVGVEQRQLRNLWAHLDAVALTGAGIFKMNGWPGNKRVEEVRLKLIPNIKPIDPQAYQAYVEALSGSGGILDGTLNNFLDSLISVLYNFLRFDGFYQSKEKLKVVYEGLRLSRNLLKQPLDQKTRDLIAVVARDVGLLICLLRQTDADDLVHAALPDLLSRIGVIGPQVEQEDFIFPKTNELGFVDYVLERLTTSNAAEIIPQTVQQDLVSLQSFLVETVELRDEQAELRVLWNRVLDVVYRVELLMDHITMENISTSLSNLCDSIIEDINGIKNDMLQVSYSSEKKGVSKVQKVVESSTINPSVADEVVGFHDDATSLVDRLTRGSQHLRIVVVSGMAGLGKTTLALKLYNDPQVMHHFHCRAWWPVSQVLDRRQLLLELFSQIQPQWCSSDESKEDLAKKTERDLAKTTEMDLAKMTEEDLADKLRRSLKGRRYLIFLDDVWSFEAWESLCGSFPDDSTQSRILLTSRYLNIAPYDMLDDEPHLLSPLDDDESLELL